MCELIDSKLASNKVVVSFSLSHHRDANYSERDVCGGLFLFGHQKTRALIITGLTTSFYTANAMKKKEECNPQLAICIVPLLSYSLIGLDTVYAKQQQPVFPELKNKSLSYLYTDGSFHALTRGAYLKA